MIDANTKSNKATLSVYLGLALLAFASLMFEVTLVRLLSVISWYHLAFFSISVGMLGMTAGAITVYLCPALFTPQSLTKVAARVCLYCGCTTLLAVIMLCQLPLAFRWSLSGVAPLLTATLVCGLPFYYTGIVVSALLTRTTFPVSRLYAADLIGAALGCIFVTFGLDIFDAPSLIIICAALSAGAGVLFAGGAGGRTRIKKVNFFAAIVLLVLAIVNSAGWRIIRPVYGKDGAVFDQQPEIEFWNSFSKIAVSPVTTEPPFYWGRSPNAPVEQALRQRFLNIDGAAATLMTEYRTDRDRAYLAYDITNIAHYLRRDGKVCVIGVGGARDLQAALLFGNKRVLGVELNPIFVKLLKSTFRKFAGVADDERVEMVVDEARSYLSRSTEQFDLIQMSLIDTWAATGAGAFSLSENALYTIEGWQVILKRLSANGIFTVSRWHHPEKLGETGRLASLAVASLLAQGITRPADHLALISTGKIATLLLSRQPFSAEELATLQQKSAELGYHVVYMPGQPPTVPILRLILSASSYDELQAATVAQPLNYTAPTDEIPYFFNMLRISSSTWHNLSEDGVIAGNLFATLTLLGLLAALSVAVVATIIIPLILARRSVSANEPKGSAFFAAAIYFSLIGASFMLVEIALIQKLTLLLGHPIYAMSVLLSTLILSAGLGSLMSPRLSLTTLPRIIAYPSVTVVTIILLGLGLDFLVYFGIGAATALRIILSVAVTFPVGVLLGLFFPTGMEMAKALRCGDTPWFWALNGVFGVFASAAAVLISIYSGISTNLHLAAIGYALTLPCLVILYRARRTVEACAEPNVNSIADTADA